MLRVQGFQGELPRIHPRFLPDTAAQLSLNAKLETGALAPFRREHLSFTLGTIAQTIYWTGSTWLSWNAVVNAVPGPVATSRIYYTGSGVPKVRKSDGTVYNLKLAPPSGKLSVALKKNNERLTLDSKEVLLANGVTGTSTNGWTISVSVAANVATVTAVNAAGVTTSAMQTVINGLKYRCSNTSTYVVPSLKKISIVQLQDDGGQTYDGSGNPIGSDTRYFDDVASFVSVNGTTLTYTAPSPASLDTTDTSGQNDPPYLTTTPANPSYAPGDPATTLFGSTTVGTIESGDKIIKVVLTIEGLCNAVLDQNQVQDLLYTYTYVTDLDEESAPAPLSDRIKWSPGQSVRVTGFSSPPGGRGINRVRVYRSQTSATGQTDLYFVQEFSATPSVYDDSIYLDPIVEPLPSLNYDQPDDNLAGLTAMPNGMMAAFVGRDLYFCEPYRPHAWPENYMLSVDNDIVGLAAFGTSLAVLTTGSPYLVQGTHPSTLAMDKLEVDYPCIAARSIVDMGYFAAYASNEGLVTISSQGAQLVSEKMITPRQWYDMNPSTFVCSKHHGRYIISHDDLASPAQRKCTIIDLTGDEPFIIRTPWRPRSFFHESGSSRLYYLFAGDSLSIMEFDRVSGPFDKYRWRSKKFVLPEPTSFSCVLVDAERISKTTTPRLLVKIYADGRLRGTTSKFGEIDRISGGYLARTWEIEISGNMIVTSIALATSPEEMASTP